MYKRKPMVLAKSKFRSALTNGSDLLTHIDGRSFQARRFRDLIALHLSDLGLEQSNLSEAQHCLVRRCATITCQLEMMESEFAKRGRATAKELDVFQRAVGSLRRTFETLGLQNGRVARDVTPPSLDEYLRTKKRVRAIEHDEKDDDIEDRAHESAH